MEELRAQIETLELQSIRGDKTTTFLPCTCFDSHPSGSNSAGPDFNARLKSESTRRIATRAGVSACADRRQGTRAACLVARLRADETYLNPSVLHVSTLRCYIFQPFGVTCFNPSVLHISTLQCYMFQPFGVTCFNPSVGVVAHRRLPTPDGVIPPHSPPGMLCNPMFEYEWGAKLTTGMSMVSLPARSVVSGRCSQSLAQPDTRYACLTKWANRFI
eukprot:7675139-Pyramimonas_sp.AAC.1